MHMLGEKWPVLKVEKLMQLRSYVFAEDIKQKKRLMSRILDMNIWNLCYHVKANWNRINSSKRAIKWFVKGSKQSYKLLQQALVCSDYIV